ncbi:MAG: DUF4173 domain-containing protein [Lachnospiraceae bacterium]|nr:DUF4173 domain-containing protein [Lachnospiraceae bacterium]
MNPCDLTNKKNIRLFRIAAIISYGIGYIYAANFWDDPNWVSGFLFFSILFIICTECFAYFSGRTFSALKSAGHTVWEGIFFAVCALAQAAALYIYGLHKDMEPAQFFMWHVTMVCYVIARTGMLINGRTGHLFWLDMVQGFFALPFGNIHLRIVSLFSSAKRNTGAKIAASPYLPNMTNAPVSERSIMANDPVLGVPNIPNAPAPATPGTPLPAAPCTPGTPLPTAKGTSAPAAPASPAPQKQPGRYSQTEKWLIAVGVLFGLILTAVIWNLLAGVSSAFSDLDFGIFKLLRSFAEMVESFYETYLANFFDDFIPKLIFSIPVGAWLFGLVGGSLKRSRPVFTEEEFQNATRSWHAFPIVTLYIVSGMLCAVYTLFFAVSLRELIGLVNITAPQASRLAVNGFWQLVRIVIINIGTLGVYSLFLKDSERNAAGTATGWSGVPRILLTVQFAFTTAFAMLAGWKLFGIYIGLFGPTPRRMLSGWFLLVLLLACIMILVQLYRKIAAARIVILTAAATFTILCCLPVGQICG